MDDDVRSAAKKVRGSITEALGKLTGDKKTEKQGSAQKQAAQAELDHSATKAAALKKKPAP